MLLIAQRIHFFKIYNRFDDKDKSVIAPFDGRYLPLQRRCIVMTFSISR